MDRFPDFHIVGAPKCGTTGLYRYLAEHPGIAMSARKEPSFWASDINLAEHRNRDDYLRLWQDAPAGAIRGEASTRYARSRVAIAGILEATPRARFIMMLRNPVEMAQAFHAQALKDFQEDVVDFEAAWLLQESRANGRHIPRECLNPELLQYRQVCALGEQLGRFVAQIPSAQRMVILYDDLAADPRAVYLDALDFLGVRDDGRSEFPRHNENVVRRSPRLATIHRRTVRRLGRLNAPLRAAAAAIGIHPSALIDRWNLARRPRPRLRPAFAAHLREAFEPDIARIEALLGRPLPDWRAH